MIALKTQNLSVGYGKKVVVQGVELCVEKGQVLCLLGPNGAGKTTILRTLSGLLEPLTGAVYINGEPIKDKPKKDLAKVLSVVLTQKASCGLMTGFEVVSLGRHPYTNRFGHLSSEDIEKTHEALKTVNAEKIAHRYFEELSDGEKQKIMVARALVQEPEVMILDEPTTHLDIRHRLELVEILKKLSKEKGIAIILSLHEIDIALKNCDQVVLVKEGQIMGYGAPDDVVNEACIQDLYDIKAANYNTLLGSIEMSNWAKPEVFVIGGGGSGVPIYRELARQGIGVATGVIHENDVDYQIARTMGIAIEKEGAFEPINDCTFTSAKRSVDGVPMVIDAGGPIGAANQRNIDLIQYALSAGKTVYSLRDSKELIRHLGNNHKQVECCAGVAQLSECIQARTAADTVQYIKRIS